MPLQDVTPDLVFTIVIFTTVLLVLVVGIVLTVLAAGRQRARQEAALATARLAYETELRNIETETREAVMAQLAAELHDNVGQLLTVLKLQLEKEKIRFPALQPPLHAMAGTVETALQQVRLLSHSLSRDFVGAQSLQSNIAREIQRLQGLGTYTLHFFADDAEPVLPGDVCTVAFRIVQEALGNALRHAGAQTIAVTLLAKDVFRLQVRDDGKGFDPAETLQAAGGLGLKNIFRRAAMAGLACDLDAAPGRGTTVTLTQLSKHPALVDLA